MLAMEAKSAFLVIAVEIKGKFNLINFNLVKLR